jgi:peptidoglycan hydrolase-like protein with peptidoglycan-binding domain
VDDRRFRLRRETAAPDGRHLRPVVSAVGLTFLCVAIAACGPTPVSGRGSGPGVLAPSVEASATPSTAPSSAPSTAPTSGASGSRQASLRLGDAGADVRELQHRLTLLGYWLGVPDGEYGQLTTQAVLALQKVAGLDRDGVFGPRTRAALHRQVQPQPQRGTGSGVEVDLDRQLLLVTKNGRTKLIINASTGSGATYLQSGSQQVALTPTGRYTVFRDVDGQDTGPLGPLWRPKYIFAGIAIHGYPDVPAYPASHGCVRISNAAMDQLWTSDLLPIGGSVWVY